MSNQNPVVTIKMQDGGIMKPMDIDPMIEEIYQLHDQGRIRGQRLQERAEA